MDCDELHSLLNGYVDGELDLVRNLEVPWAIAFLPDGDALVTEDERLLLERRFGLESPQWREGATWRYVLRDRSRENIAALVAHPAVDDTHDQRLERVATRSGIAHDRSSLSWTL